MGLNNLLFCLLRCDRTTSISILAGRLDLLWLGQMEGLEGTSEYCDKWPAPNAVARDSALAYGVQATFLPPRALGGILNADCAPGISSVE